MILEIGSQYAIELFIAFLCGALVVIFVSFIWHTTQQQKIEAQKKLSTPEIESQHILANAQKEAIEIIRVATEKAREILESTAHVKEEVSSSLAKELTDIAEQHKRYLQDASLKYVEVYEHMAERAQEEYLSTLHEASQGMAGDAKHTLDMFETFLKDQTIGYKQQMEKKIDDLRNKVNEQVNEYKKEKLKRVDKAINEIVTLVAKIVIGRSLNIKEHNELVLRALEEAKKEGFFSHLEL